MPFLDIDSNFWIWSQIFCFFTGITKNRINATGFSSVTVHQDQVYAATLNDPKTVIVYKHSGRDWNKVHSFTVAMEGFITLSVKNNSMKCSSTREDKIEVYSLSGELLQTHGTWGSDDAGELSCSAICADDEEGSVLIADRDNNRLQVMSEKGEFTVLQLQPPVTEPCSAVVFNDKLYVTSDDNKKIYKYA